MQKKKKNVWEGSSEFTTSFKHIEKMEAIKEK